MVIIINSDIMMIYGDIPFGNDQQFANLKVVIEIVDLPIKVVTFHSYVELPEGNWWLIIGCKKCL